MKRESLLNIRTCREIVTGMDVARSKKTAPTMFQRMRRIIARGTEEIAPHPNEASVALALDKERRRFKRRLQIVEKGAAKILGFRRKLAATHAKNQRIMDLRLQLQKHYWDSTSSIQPTKKHRKSNSSAAQSLTSQETSRRYKVKRLRYGGRA